MNTVRSWLSGAAAPGNPTVEDQDVYPVHVLDRMPDYQKVVARVMLFNDVLDADLLSASLSKLLEIGDWRKLGGRLIRDANGQLQIQVPPTFTAGQPAITYTQERLQHMKIDQHPVAQKLPRRTSGPSIQPMPSSAEFRTMQVRKDFPTSVEVLIKASLPLISLHIHSFQDATVVGLAWPHTLMDGAGVASLMKSWSLVMGGQEEQVPTVAGARHDVLTDLPPTDLDQDKILAANGLLRGAGLASLACHFLWEKITGSGRVSKAVYLPSATYDKLVGRIKDEASSMETSSNNKPFVSATDALAGWITKTVALSEHRPRPFTVLGLVNGRYRLGSLLDPKGVYLQNMIMITYTLFTAQQARGSVAALALAHREQVAEQTTQSRVISFIQWLGKQINGNKNAIALCGEVDSVFISVNNLTRVDLITGVDFAPAVVGQGEPTDARHNPPGTMVHLFFKEANAEITPINALTVIGKDHGNGTWLAGNLSLQTWKHLEEQVKA